MKKVLLVVVFILLSALVFAENEEPKKFGLDIGGELTTGYAKGTGEWADLGMIMFFIATLRAGPLVDFTYAITDMISIGGEAGFMFMQFEDPEGNVSTTAIDIPVRAICRLQLGPLLLQPHAGAWIGVSEADIFQGLNLDFGTKLGFGKKFKFYLTASYILGLSGNLSYPRFGLGLAYNILNF